jgi:SAM-dependent methyltransferase
LDQHYSEHYRCLINVDSSHDLTANFSLKADSKRKAIKEWIVQNASKKFDSKNMYNMIDQTDLGYGPLFQRLEEVKAGSNPDTAFGSFLAPDTAATMPYQYESEFVIHPVTLDVCFQISWPILTKAGAIAVELHVPTYIKKLEIAVNLCKNGRNRLRVYGHRVSTDTRSNQQITSIYVERGDEADDAFAFETENFTVTSLGGNTSPPKESRLAFKLSWQPHFRLVSSKQFQALFPQSPLSQRSLDSMAAKDKAALVFADRAIRQIQPEQITKMQGHHRKLYSWLENQSTRGIDVSRALRDDRASGILLKHDEEIIDYVRSECGPGGRFLCKIGEHLPSILTGETNPLAVMMEDDLLGEVYRSEEMGIRTYPQAAQYVGLLTHQNPYLKILEVGAGTCAATHTILPVIAGPLGNQARFSRYTCTDISTGFFDGARQLLEPWASLLQFEPLDIEIDPREQGFAEAEFDLVIASNVLHATKNMENTMRNVRRLLKPSGNILIIETTVMTLRTFMYGTLPGWWLGGSCHLIWSFVTHC